MTNSNGTGEPAPLRLRSPEDVVSAIPYLIGFHPADSVVVLGTGGPQRTVTLRFDLPVGRAAGRLASHIADLLAGHQFTDVLVVGYGTQPQVAPLLHELRRALEPGPFQLGALLRVEGGCWWSYLCDHDPPCLPPSGTPFDATASPIAAQAILDGRAALPDRHALERTLAPVGGTAREAMRLATDRAELRFMRWVRAMPDIQSVRQRMVDEGIPLVHGLPGPPLGDDEVAWLGVLLTHLRVRDEAWVRIGDDDLDQHIALWGDVLRRVEEPYAAGPACLLAFAVWRDGNGALANIALDRAFDADPGYTMAGLLHELIACGVPPSAAQHMMTPDELATAWDARDANDREAPHAPGPGSDPNSEPSSGPDPGAGSSPGTSPRHAGAPARPSPRRRHGSRRRVRRRKKKSKNKRKPGKRT